jgi:hypothetical protein
LQPAAADPSSFCILHVGAQQAKFLTSSPILLAAKRIQKLYIPKQCKLIPFEKLVHTRERFAQSCSLFGLLWSMERILIVFFSVLVRRVMSHAHQGCLIAITLIDFLRCTCGKAVL